MKDENFDPVFLPRTMFRDKKHIILKPIHSSLRSESIYNLEKTYITKLIYKCVFIHNNIVQYYTIMVTPIFVRTVLGTYRALIKI